MELMILKEKCLKPYSTLAVVDYRKLAREIEDSPEDYIFVLTPDEWRRYLELNGQMLGRMQGNPVRIDEHAYTTQYQGVFVIATVAIQPQFVKKYKIGGATNRALLGDNHAVFYVDRTGRDMERAREVLSLIQDFRKRTRQSSSN